MADIDKLPISEWMGTVGRNATTTLQSDWARSLLKGWAGSKSQMAYPWANSYVEELTMGILYKD